VLEKISHTGCDQKTSDYSSKQRYGWTDDDDDDEEPEGQAMQGTETD